MTGPWEVLHGDCLERMAEMGTASVDLIVTDPPYYRVKNLAWDRAWKSADEFVAWFGRLCEQWRRILKPNGSLYVFMGDEMVARVEVELARWFTVLNRVVWVKADAQGNGQWKKQNPDGWLHSYFAQAEYVLFAEQQGADSMAMGKSGYAAQCERLHGFMFEPLRAYLDGERRRAGIDKALCNEACGFSLSPGGMASRHYFSASQWYLPTEAHYSALQRLFNERGRRPAPPWEEYHAAPRGHFEPEYLSRPHAHLEASYTALRADYEYLRADYEYLRRPFHVTPQVPYTDVWTTFPTVPHKPGKHPCEKPVPMLRHIVRTSSRPGAVVLDCFAGSCATGEATLAEGRTFVGIEGDAAWVERGQHRLQAVAPQAELFAEAAG